jgi:universal stress protein A
MFAPKTILVPTDFSEYSDYAFEQAVDIARQHKAKIFLFHVNAAVQQCSVDYCLDDATVKTVEQKSMESADAMMKKQIDTVVKSKDVDIVSDIVSGVPYEEILKEQEAKNIDLIVIASHGRTGLVGHLMGSVTEKVARGSKCPVVIAKKK